MRPASSSPHAAALAALVITVGGCASSHSALPPPPPEPVQARGDDRPPMQIAVDPVDVDPFERRPPDPPPREEDPCGVALSARLARCAPLPAFRAAATGSSGTAQQAFDGSTCTAWNAGGFAPQSVMVDLGGSRRIDAVVLVPEMSPGGAVVHRIEVSDRDAPGSFQSAHRIESPMQTGAPVELVFPRPERARFVQIASDASPSWIAWREIVLLDCSGR